MKISIFISLLILAAKPISSQSSTCTVCRCYKINCAKLDDTDIDCFDAYKDSCDNSEDITEEDGCNIDCDCCLEGECHSWSSFKCIIYRTYEFSSVLYFILFSVHFFLLWRLKRHFFTVKKKWEVQTNQKEKKGDEQKQFFKYQKLIWIKRHPDISKKNQSSEKIKSVVALFGRIEDLRSLAIKNMIVFNIFMLYYLVMSGLNFYVLFTLVDKPLTYFYICWIQHTMLITFWVLLFLLFKKFPSYSKNVIRLLEEFEVERNCKVRLVDKIHFLEINFDPQKFLKKRDYSKPDVKEFGDHEKELFDLANENIGKIKLGDDKPRISINKVKPLN